MRLIVSDKSFVLFARSFFWLFRDQTFVTRLFISKCLIIFLQNRRIQCRLVFRVCKRPDKYWLYNVVVIIINNTQIQLTVKLKQKSCRFYLCFNNRKNFRVIVYKFGISLLIFRCECGYLAFRKNFSFNFTTFILPC